MEALAPIHPYWREYTLEQCLAYYEQVESEPDMAVRKEQQRILCRQDLFYLGVNICGRKDLIHPWLYARLREYEASPHGHIDLWPRDHRKSTIITFLGTIQDILNNPEITVGIFSHTRPIARAFLVQIKREFENNIELKWLFDDVLYDKPQTQAEKWSEDDGLIVKRQTNPKEATVEAWGLVDGQPTSRHFNTRVYDDVVVKESVTNPEQIKKTTGAFQLSDNLGTVNGKVKVVGTFYHQFDTYREMINSGQLKARIYAACGVDILGNPDFKTSVFLSPDELEKKKIAQGIYVFNCQMLLNPTADKVQGFQEKWLNYWDAKDSRNLLVLFLVDPAKTKKNKSDYTCIWVVGLGADKRYYILDILRDRLNLPERRRAVYSLAASWKPHKIFYEENGSIADIEHINEWGDIEHNKLPIVPLSLDTTMTKADRIKSLVPIFEERRILLPTSLIRRDYEDKSVNLVRIFKEEEYLSFPVLKHDDMLDALSQINHELVKQVPWPKAAAPEKKFDAIAHIRAQQRRDRPVV